MTLRSRMRDWLLANDPAFSRLRQASRITATIVVSVLILMAVHYLIVPLPPVDRHLPISRDDAELGLEMIGVSLNRLHL